MPTCKSCGAEIEWIKTPNGKKCPIDAKAKKVWVLDKLLNNWFLCDGHESHFATCPNADMHRKPSTE